MYTLDKTTRRLAYLLKGQEDDIDPAVAELMGWTKKPSAAEAPATHPGYGEVGVDPSKATMVRELKGDGWMSPDGDLWQVPQGTIHTSVLTPGSAADAQDYTKMLHNNWMRVVNQDHMTGVHGHERNRAKMRDVVARHVGRNPNKHVSFDLMDDAGKHRGGWSGKAGDWLMEGQPVEAPRPRGRIVLALDDAQASLSRILKARGR